MTDQDRQDDRLDERLELPGLKLRWNDARTERLLSAVQMRLRRRRVGRAAAPVAVVVAGGVGAAVLVLGGREAARERPAPPARVVQESVIQLAEGSQIHLQRATAEVRVLEEQPSRVRLDQVRGAARYVVVPYRDRAFEVHAGSITVTVVGTEFVVERRGEAALVQVDRGKVGVAWSEGGDAHQTMLGAGERGLFPPPVAAAPVSAAPESGEAAAAPAARAMGSYRAQVARRDYQAAYAALSRDPALAGQTVEDLLVAADVARLSEHPGQAVVYLQRIVRDHPRDQRAPLAAFTLGRTLSGLGRQRQAMEMFARVHTAWPAGPLAEDALVREAEAAAALGDTARAARLAAQYERDHPGGARRAEVRRYAKLTPVE